MVQSYVALVVRFNFTLFPLNETTAFFYVLAAWVQGFDSEEFVVLPEYCHPVIIGHGRRVGNQ